MPDPFAHGTPAGDDHTWVDPGRMACPDCPCCLRRLCQTARDQQRPCTDLVMLDPDVMPVDGCPCSVTDQPTIQEAPSGT